MYIPGVTCNTDNGSACDMNVNKDHDKSPNHARDKGPSHMDVRSMVLEELHQALYSVHLGYQKTITTTRKFYFCLD